MDRLVYFLSGEFLLKNRPNGGTAVLLRSLLVTSLVLLVALPIKSYCAEHTRLSFSFEQLKAEAGSMLPWAGAIFAGVYAAFYSRFAAQWAYLASLYNQLMQTCVSLPAAQLKGNRGLANWHAAFIEDAQDLHLARKSMFRSVVIGLMQSPENVQAFVEGTERGSERLKELEVALGFTAAPTSSPAPHAAAPGPQSAPASLSAPA